MSWNREAEHAAAREWGAKNYNWIIKWRIAKSVMFWVAILGAAAYVLMSAK